MTTQPTTRFEIKRVYSSTSALGFFIYQVIDTLTGEIKGARINVEGARELVQRLECAGIQA
jgi:hypothetical protein